MSNPFDEVRLAVQEAKLQQEAVDDATDSMVQLVVGRLHHVGSYRGVEALKKMKRELRNFSAVTGRWSD